MVKTTSNFMVDVLSVAAFANNEDTKMLLSQLLDVYKFAKKKDPTSLNEDFEVFWSIISDIVESDMTLNKKAEVRRVCLKVKNSPLGKADPMLVETIEALLLDPDGLSDKRIDELKLKIRQWLTMNSINSDVKKIMFNCNKYNPDNNLDTELLIEDILTGMRDVMNKAENCGGSSQTIASVNMSDKSSVLKSISIWRNQHDGYAFPTGLQGLNRMLPPNGGFEKGNLYCFASLSHNYKSGILMDCARWLTTLSTVKSEDGKQPCVLFISLENEVPENTIEMMKRAYNNAYREPVPEGMTDEQLCDCVTGYYNRNGSALIMLRKDDQFGYSDLVGTIEDLEKRGMSVFAVIIDYLTLMRTDGSEDNMAKRYQKLGHALHDLAAHTNRIVITAVQLSGEADILVSSGQTNIVKRFSAAHLADAKGLKREFDCLIFMHIEKNQDEVPFLTFAWNKKRYGTPPDKKDQYCAYRFEGPTLGIVDDYGSSQDRSYRDIFSGTELAKQETADNPFEMMNKKKKEVPISSGFGLAPVPKTEEEKTPVLALTGLEIKQPVVQQEEQKPVVVNTFTEKPVEKISDQDEPIVHEKPEPPKNNIEDDEEPLSVPIMIC